MLAHICAWRPAGRRGSGVRCGGSLRDGLAHERMVRCAAEPHCQYDPSASILAFRPRQRYDLICTHSFLDFIPPADRRDSAPALERVAGRRRQLCFSNLVSDQPVPEDTGRRSAPHHCHDCAGDRASVEPRRMSLPCDRPTFEALIREAGLLAGRGCASHVAAIDPLVDRGCGTGGRDRRAGHEAHSGRGGSARSLSTRGPERPRIWFQVGRP